MSKDQAMNVMRKIKIAKIVLSMGVGEPGKKLDQAKLVMERLTGKKAVITKAKKKIPSWKVRPGLPIGIKVTLRKKDDINKLLPRLFEACENQVKRSSFTEGNFSFGVDEYIHVPGMEYDPDIGIVGFDTTICMERPGSRVKRRKIKRSSIGKGHGISVEESIDFIKNSFGVKIV